MYFHLMQVSFSIFLTLPNVVNARMQWNRIHIDFSESFFVYLYVRWLQSQWIQLYCVPAHPCRRSGDKNICNFLPKWNCSLFLYHQ